MRNSHGARQITNNSEARGRLAELIEKVLQGDEVIIGKAGKPVAKLVPCNLETPPRRLGVGRWRGRVWMADDFDGLPGEVLQFFSGEAEGEAASPSPGPFLTE